MVRKREASVHGIEAFRTTWLRHRLEHVLFVRIASNANKNFEQGFHVFMESKNSCHSVIHG